MELNLEQKQKFARLAILHRISQRITDLWRIELEAELLRGIGRTDEEVDALVLAAQAERAGTETILIFIEAGGDPPSFELVPDLPLICGFFVLLEELLPLSSDWSRSVYTIKQSSDWRVGAWRDLVPAVPRETVKDRYQEGFAAGYAEAQDEAWELLEAHGIARDGNYRVNGVVVDETTMEPVEEDAEQ